MTRLVQVTTHAGSAEPSLHSPNARAHHPPVSGSIASPSFGSVMARVLYGAASDLEDAMADERPAVGKARFYPVRLPAPLRRADEPVESENRRDRSVRSILATVVEVAELEVRVRHFDPDQGETIERWLDRSAVSSAWNGLTAGQRVTIRRWDAAGSVREVVEPGWAPFASEVIEARLRSLGSMSEDDDDLTD